MATEQYIEIYRVLMVIAFIISAINWLGYTIFAPWNKSVLGRIVWTKFLANTLILLVPFLQIMFSDVPFRREFSIFAMLMFITALAFVSYGIYVIQLRGYIRYRLGKHHDKRQKVT